MGLTKKDSIFIILLNSFNGFSNKLNNLKLTTNKGVVINTNISEKEEITNLFAPLTATTNSFIIKDAKNR